jgi:hypothetical protein
LIPKSYATAAFPVSTSPPEVEEALARSDSGDDTVPFDWNTAEGRTVREEGARMYCENGTADACCKLKLRAASSILSAMAICTVL